VRITLIPTTLRLDALVQSTFLFNPASSLITRGDLGNEIALSLSAWIVDLVLFIRLIVVYPYRSSTRLRFASIIAFPIAIKAARLACVIVQDNQLHLAQTVDGSEPDTTAFVSQQGWSSLATAEWILQPLDNG
jgi:hypothetical protein